MRKVDQESYNRRKMAIIAAAQECFSEKGLMGASIADICARAQISPGNLYHYFPDKRAVIEAAVVASVSEVITRTREMLKQIDVFDALFNLEQIVRIAAESWRVSPGLRLEMLAASERDPRLATQIGLQTAAMREMVEGTVRQAQASGRLPDGFDAQQLVDMVELIWAGLPVVRIIDPEFEPARYGAAVRALLSSV